MNFNPKMWKKVGGTTMKLKAGHVAFLNEMALVDFDGALKW